MPTRVARRDLGSRRRIALEKRFGHFLFVRQVKPPATRPKRTADSCFSATADCEFVTPPHFMGRIKGSGAIGGSGALATPASVASVWPSDVRYVSALVWGEDVKRAKEVYAKYKHSREGEHVVASPASVRKTVRWRRVDDPNHPAFGENGLFAARRLNPGEHVVDYLGYVCLSGNEDPLSDYSASFGEHHELALDAARVGNEARMCNDFRNTGKRANAVFDQYRDAAGDQKLAIFVHSASIKKGEEILVSYGKGFWRARRDASSLETVE